MHKFENCKTEIFKFQNYSEIFKFQNYQKFEDSKINKNFRMYN